MSTTHAPSMARWWHDDTVEEVTRRTRSSESVAERRTTMCPVTVQTVWADITSSMTNPTRRISGIQRVELELALRLSDLRPVEFVHYDHRRRVFVGVTKEAVLERHRHLVTETASGSGPVGPVHRVRRARAGAWFVDHVPRRLRPDLAMKAAWAVEERVTSLARRTRSALRPERTTPGGRPGDLLLCLTLHRDPAVVVDLKRWVAASRLELVTLLYDVVPSIAPQFSTIDPVVFDANFREIVRDSARLLTISECSAADIRGLCARLGIDCPPTDVLHLASALTDAAPRRPEGVSLPDEFVLCIGTIEPRKNHPLLLDVWESFSRDGVADAPVLVLAGAPGWLAQETMHRIRCAPGLRGSVVFVDSPSDPELHWLLRHCAFTLYPSLYEGWGLPVTESFDVGKACLTTDRGSLLEAGEGLAVHLDALDRSAWSDAILGLWRDVERRRRLEDHLRRSRTPRSVIDVAADLDAILG